MIDTGRLAGLLDGRVPWLSVRAAGAVPPGWVSCADVLASQCAGGDPTAAWRETLQAQYGAQYGIEAPRQVAAMFVLMWYAGVPAFVAATALALTGYAPAPDSLAFRRHPSQHYPDRIVLLPGSLLPAGQAAEAVRAHCAAFAESYRPGVKLSSRQRHGAVADELRSALNRCGGGPYAGEAAELLGVGLGSAERESCCYIYALPGASECSGCPRLRV